MKKLNIYIVFFFSILLMQSCLHEEKDVFGKSPSERLNEAQKLYDKILTSAPNGWQLEYIAGDTDAARRGAFNFLLKFENGEVTASVDALALDDIDPGIDNRYKKISSLYKLEQDMSITLSFDTYNSFLHYYHEQHGGYFTYKGDFEFTIMEASDELIILRGKKYGNIMEMHRMPENITWEQYLEPINNVIENTSMYTGYQLLKGGNAIANITVSANYRFTFKESEELSHSTNAIYTQKGIKLLSAITIGDTEIQDLVWDGAKELFISATNAAITMLPVVPPSYLFYEQFLGSYTMNCSSPGLSTPYTSTVTIEEKVKGSTMTIKGLTDFDMELVYNKNTGTVSLLNQDIGKSSDGYTVVLNAWDTNAGYLTWGIGIGMVSQLNLESIAKGEIKFVFADNGAWVSYSANAFLLRIYDSVLGAHGSATYKRAYEGRSRFINIIMTKK